MMESSNPLSQLKDLHLPEKHSWLFPLATGWYILLMVLAIIILTSLIYYLRKSNKNKQFNQINKLLNEIENNNTLEDNIIIEQTSLLLKRITIMKYPDDNSNRLNGQKWFDYLQQKAPKLNLVQLELQYLTNIYQKQQLTDRAKFFTSVRLLIRTLI